MKKITELNLAEKTVFLRTEFNVPLDERFEVADDSRLRASLPTIQYLCEKGASVMICSHLGRPRGERNPACSFKHVVGRLSDLLGQPVAFADDCIGPAREQAQAALEPGQVLLLENVRYHREEEANDPAFAKELSAGVDVYVNDAFGNSHRAHASMVGVSGCVPEKAAGLLVEREVGAIADFLENPQHPAVLVIGGAKVAGKSGKIHVIRNLLPVVDTVCIVGKIAYFFLQAQGISVGATISGDQRQIDAPDADLEHSLDDCRAMLKEAEALGKKIILPLDSVAKLLDGDKAFTVDHDGFNPIPPDAACLDMGPRTLAEIKEVIAGAKSVAWNGPAGYFEDERFQAGSLSIARAIEQSSARAIAGGGDTLAALKQVGLSSDNLHLCTGGGAMLNMLMGRELPAVAALR